MGRRRSGCCLHPDYSATEATIDPFVLHGATASYSSSSSMNPILAKLATLLHQTRFGLLGSNSILGTSVSVSMLMA